MASTNELETKLERQTADYLSRLEKGGQLPTVISKAWNEAGGAETAKLRGEEAGLLKNYVSAGAEAREKYKDVWDPFARDTLASKQVALNYSPIADIRKELAMRAEALGVATSSASSMYQAGTDVAKEGMGFTQSAYERALQKEQEAQRQKEAAEAEATRQREREQDYQRALEAEQRAASSKSSGGGGGGGTKSKTAVASDLKDDIQSGISDIVGNGLQRWATEDLIKRLQQAYPEIAPLEIEKQVYAYRKPFEEQYTF